MLGRFGLSLFGLTEFIRRAIGGSAKLVACVGDTSTHGGSITSSGQDGTMTAGGVEVAVSGATFVCPIHGARTVSSIISKTTQNGKLLITDGAVVSCGATIVATDRGFYAG